MCTPPTIEGSGPRHQTGETGPISHGAPAHGYGKSVEADIEGIPLPAASAIAPPPSPAATKAGQHDRGQDHEPDTHTPPASYKRHQPPVTSRRAAQNTRYSLVHSLPSNAAAAKPRRAGTMTSSVNSGGPSAASSAHTWGTRQEGCSCQCV